MSTRLQCDPKKIARYYAERLADVQGVLPESRDDIVQETADLIEDAIIEALQDEGIFY